MRKKTEEKIKKIVKDNYEDIAEEFSLSRQKELWPKLIKYSKLVPDNSDVFDVACGNGRLLKAFINKKINYLGCDQSNNLIKLASKEWPNQKFIKCSLPDLPNQKFDYIFFIAAFHHIPGKKERLKTLLNLKNCLKDSGRIIISVWNLRQRKKKLIWQTWFKYLFKKDRLDFGDLFFNWKNEKTKEKNNLRYYHAFSKKELKKLIKQVNLKVNTIEEDDYNIWLVLSK